MSVGMSPGERRTRPSRERVAAQELRGAARSSSLRKAAVVLSSLEPALARNLLSQLGSAEVDALQEELSRLVSVDQAEQHAVLEEFLKLASRRHFVFEDIPHVADSLLRAVYRDEDELVWALALAGASRQTRAKVLDALNATRADTLRHTLATLGPLRLDDVEAAQASLAERIDQHLDAAGNPSPQDVEEEGLLA